MHDLWKTKDCQLCDCLSYFWAGLVKADIPAPILISRVTPISVVTANIKLPLSRLYSELVEVIEHNSGGVLIFSRVEVGEDARKEGKLEYHLDNCIKSISGETYVVHETIPVPALTI